MTVTYNVFSGRSVEWLQALADGVFAVALTLLVLDLRLPDVHAGTDAELWQRLRDLAPNAAAYLLSFTMLGTFWLAGHTLLEQCERSDRTMAWAVLAFLCFVATLPFSASVLADHLQLHVAVILYWLNLAALGATLAWMVVHAGRGLIPRSGARRSS